MTELAVERVPEKFACGETFVPKTRYIDPEYLRLELDRLFTQVWQAACREDRRRKQGSRKPEDAERGFHSTASKVYG